MLSMYCLWYYPGKERALKVPHCVAYQREYTASLVKLLWVATLFHLCRLLMLGFEFDILMIGNHKTLCIKRVAMLVCIHKNNEVFYGTFKTNSFICV